MSRSMFISRYIIICLYSSTQEAEAGAAKVSIKPRLHNKTLFQKKIKTIYFSYFLM